ncbi:MAG: cellulase family glycosylhydrolase [Clostridiaceae bacterium]|nr:cellulase family glycosylhydrolase [Clostridiaceae bacterium]
MTLTDENGQPIQLRGMSTHGLQWFGEIINENAFATLSNDWESNVIRLAMYVGESGYAEDPSVKDLVYEGIELAFANDMYVIVDWHVHAPGDPNSDVYKGAYDFFDELSAHYQDHPKAHQIIWELCNEPSPNNAGGEGITNDAAGWQAVKSYAEPIVDMLRERGDNIIIVGTPNWSQRADLAADNPIAADNIMYAIHFYSGTHESSSENTDRNNVMSNARYALDNGAAIFVTEWGTSEANGNNGPYLEDADTWLSFLNENNISWCNWSLTNKNETSGSFIPYIMGVSEATLLDPGDDQVWAPEEISLSGEYVRARIKGIAYEPMSRGGDAYEEIIWNFDDAATQGFEINRDSPVKDVEVSYVDGMMRLSSMTKSTNITEDNYWSNVRISSEQYNPGFDIFGADKISMKLLVEEPTSVSIACVPQSDKNGWANPSKALIAGPSDFTETDNGLFMAEISMGADFAKNLEAIATDPEGSILSNMVIFVGSENGGDVYIDDITFSSAGSAAAEELEHAEIGMAALPSDFDDNTRQGWDWSVDSGTKVSLLIEEANGSPALSFNFAYPEVKPTDNWASAPRLDLWLEGLQQGENDYLIFDLYLQPEQASKGAIAISGAFQPPESGYWAQVPDSFNIELAELDDMEKTADGLYHFLVKMDLNTIEGIGADTDLRNILLIFADIETDFSGKMFVDNVQLLTEAELADLTGGDDSSADETTAETSVDTGTESSQPQDSDDSAQKGWIIWVIVASMVVIAAAVVIVVIYKKKKAKIFDTKKS